MIRVQQDDSGLTVWRYDNLQDGRRSYWTFDGKAKVVKAGDPAPWWFVLSKDDALALASSLTDFAENRSPEYAELRGELRATRLHLADMRKLVMLEPGERELSA